MSGLEVTVLASGSRGNCTLVRAPGHALLIDAGISTRQILARLSAAGCAPEEIRAVVLTHEHHDHVCGLPRLLARLDAVSVFGTRATLSAVSSGLDASVKLEPIRAGEQLTAGEFALRSFSVPHDAGDPVGLTVEWSGRRVGYATDLGHVTDEVSDGLAECDMLVFEANHDREMLLAGPYPWATKRRVASATGHLSNEHAAAELVRIVCDRTQALVLAHLSQTNNDPALALEAVGGALEAAGGPMPRVVAARQERPLEPVVL